jgi:hypothetical protein
VQVAQQQAKYLAKVFNKHHPQPGSDPKVPAFVYRWALALYLRTATR